MMKRLPYYLDIKDKVKKFLIKQDKQVKIRCYKKFAELKKNPIPSNKKHILDIKGNKLLCESGVDKLRFYYIIDNTRIIIEKIEYAGIVQLEYAFSNHKSGNKNYPNQQKFIKWIKKLFSKF